MRSPPRVWRRPRQTCPACASSGRGPAHAPSPSPLPASAGGDDGRAGRGDSGRRRRSRQAAALADLDEQAAFEAVDALARVDVLRPQPPLAFVHPLIRAAVYETLTPLERDRGHARAARLLANAGAEPERVAAHLLRCPRPRMQVVATLREAARRAGGRGASESAVAYLRRALEEPPPDAERAEVLLELGAAEAREREAAIEHLREAHALAASPCGAPRPRDCSAASCSSSAERRRTPCSRRRSTSLPGPILSSSASSRPA